MKLHKFDELKQVMIIEQIENSNDTIKGPTVCINNQMAQNICIVSEKGKKTPMKNECEKREKMSN